MKIFLASSRDNRELVRGIMDKLEAAGHHITYRWPEYTATKGVWSYEGMRDLYRRQREGVLACDVFLLLTPGGINAHCELTMAIENNIPRYVLFRDPHEVKCKEADALACPSYFSPGTPGTYYGDRDIAEFVLILLATHVPHETRCEGCEG